jgi:two-component system, NtrC family, response regulator AtoC
MEIGNPMAKLKILVIDDEKLIRWSFLKNLEQEGYEVFTAASGEEGFEIVKQELPDLVILDIRLPGKDGIEVLREIKETHPATLVVMMTAHGSIETVVQAMKAGAFDYMSKPVQLEEMNLLIKKALKTIRLQEEVSWLRHQTEDRGEAPDIVGRTQIMKNLCDLLQKVVAGETTTILLEGESGTGKDLFAKTIHQLSPRHSRPFLDINCSAIQETLVESELFGFEKGAFTDAKTSKKGLFELAEGGTIYLDEIAEISLGVQAKLLKFIENRCFKRVGGIKDIFVDVRIIAATNKDLRGAVSQGKFREDLYFRLKVIPIHLPPLRERGEDIPLLAEFFVNKFNRELKKQVRGFSPEALDLLTAYPWPGNIRELKNVIERVMLLESDERILPVHLPLEIRSRSVTPDEPSVLTKISGSLPDGGISMEDLEKELLKRALAKAEGNQTKAARLLDISRDTLRYRMKKFGLS